MKNIPDIASFSNTITKRMVEIMDERGMVYEKITHVTKTVNNGVEVHAVECRLPGDAGTYDIHLSDGYRVMVEQSKDIPDEEFDEWFAKGVDDSAEGLAKIYQDNVIHALRHQEDLKKMENGMNNPDFILDHVCIELVDLESNRALIANNEPVSPYIHEYDRYFAARYYISKFGMRAFLTRGNVARHGFTCDELKRHGIENLERFAAKHFEANDIDAELLSMAGLPPELAQYDERDVRGITVFRMDPYKVSGLLTSPKLLALAAAICGINVQAVVLPSSTDELMIMSNDDGELDLQELSEVVKYVNHDSDSVEASCVLSDHAMTVDMPSGKLTVL